MPFHALDAFLIYLLVQTLVAISPGPAVLLVVSQGMRHGTRASVVGAIGIEAGNVCWFALSAIGLGAAIQTSAWVFDLLRWAGAAYLAWLGLTMLWQVRRPLPAVQPVTTATGRLFRDGMLTQLANPKAMVYFTALLPQFIDPAQSIPLQCAVIGTLTVLIEIPVFTAYGWLGHRSRHVLGGGPGMRVFLGGVGAFLVAAGARLAWPGGR